MPKKVFFLIALFWTGIILFFCLASFKDVPLESVSNIDKYVHTFFYFVFTSAWFLFLKKQMKNSSKIKLITISFTLSVLFGIGIEMLQEFFTTTRHADIYDVLANTTGAILAVLIIVFIDRKQYLDKI